MWRHTYGRPLRLASHVIPDLSVEQDHFGSRVKIMARPSDADTATARGAAQYGLARRPLVSSVVAPRSYIMKVGKDAPLWISRYYTDICCDYRAGQTSRGSRRFDEAPGLHQSEQRGRPYLRE